MQDLNDRIESYLLDRNLLVVDRLGAGTQGTVILVEHPDQHSQFAVKFHLREQAYARERDVYYRLQDLNITNVNGHKVPILLGCDDAFLAIEMTIVSPPFCLDFGGAYLDEPPDYSDEVWADWRDDKSELFEQNWPAVEEILAVFRSFNVFIADVNPGNIRFK